MRVDQLTFAIPNFQFSEIHKKRASAVVSRHTENGNRPITVGFVLPSFGVAPAVMVFWRYYRHDGALQFFAGACNAVNDHSKYPAGERSGPKSTPGERLGFL